VQAGTIIQWTSTAPYSEELFSQLEAKQRITLRKKSKRPEEQGLKNVSSVVHIGYGAEEITMLARNTPDNFAAMCTHGRSGVTRWILGSVTESVGRHSGDPVLIIRAAGNISSRALAPYYIYRPADCESRRLRHSGRQ